MAIAPKQKQEPPMVPKVLPLTVPVIIKPGIDPEEFAKQYYPELTADVLGWMFAKVPTDQFVDSIARAKKFHAVLEKWIKSANEAMKAKVDLPSIVNESTTTRGTLYMAVTTLRERVDIDRDKVKTDMGEEWYAAHCTPVQYTEIRYRPLQGEKGGEDPQE